ncbi:hypothetical protein [Nocardia mexicana]|uniref:Uncharacterized protein n=1 Tax=Nocardia mexicana TaxID=279262 RepID=A0A370HAW2_9NOCA|nr:hypothetical protein [Nocardia mexicana]RDI51718.1 hypothetical protein DFR68_104202 [Nocardia mexicana]
MDYVAEIERIAAESRRRTGLLLDEIEEVNRRTAETSRQLQERWAQEAVAEEEARAEAEERERQEAEAREQREAIARAAAARRANQNFVPVDDEDEDDAYYRRKSWLE